MWSFDKEWFVAESNLTGVLRLFHKSCPRLTSLPHWAWIGEAGFDYCINCNKKPPDEFITQAMLMGAELGKLRE